MLRGQLQTVMLTAQGFTIRVKDSDMIGLGLLAVFAFALVVWLFLLPSNKPKSALNKVNLQRPTIPGKKKSGAYSLSFYSVLLKIPVLRKIVKGIKRKLGNMCPYDEKTLDRKTAGIVVKCSVVGVLACFAEAIVNLLSTKGADWFGVVTSLLAFYVAWNELSRVECMRFQKFINSNLAFYFTNVKHRYESTKNIVAAIVEGSDELPFEIVRHADEMARILSAGDSDGAVGRYINDRSGNRYLRLFMGQAFEVMERGDQTENGESLFLKNLEVLRTEMLASEIKIEKKYWRLSGYALATLLPIFAMSVVRSWSISLDEQTIFFYRAYGPFIQVGALAISLLVYRILNHSKAMAGHEDRTGEGLISNKRYEAIGKRLGLNQVSDRVPVSYRDNLAQMLRTTGIDMPVTIFLLRSLVYAALGFLFAIMIIGHSHAARRTEYLRTISNFNNRIVAVSETQRGNIRDVCLELVNKYKNADMQSVDDGELLKEIENRTGFLGEQVKTEMLTVIRENIEAYQNESWQWYDIFIALLGLLCGLINIFELMYYNSLCKEEKVVEVREFQLIVLLERKFVNATIYDMLQEMAAHAIFYREKLQRAVIMSLEDVESALEYLHNDENPSFRSLIDGFRSVDAVGIKAAFAEVRADIKSDEKTEELYDEMNFDKKLNVIELISYLPAILVVGVYFILPFLLVSFEGVFEVFSTLEESGLI